MDIVNKCSKGAFYLPFVLFLFCCLPSTISLGSDVLKYPHWIKNQNLNYSIAIISGQLDMEKNEYIPQKYVVVLELDTKQYEDLRQLTEDDWSELLKNEETDFATNLILHFVWEKDAFHMYRNDESFWRKEYKEQDIDFWKENISQFSEKLDWFLE